MMQRNNDKKTNNNNNNNSVTNVPGGGGSSYMHGVVFCRFPCSAPKPFNLVVRTITRDTKERVEKLYSPPSSSASAPTSTTSTSSLSPTTSPTTTSPTHRHHNKRKMKKRKTPMEKFTNAILARVLPNEGSLITFDELNETAPIVAQFGTDKVSAIGNVDHKLFRNGIFAGPPPPPRYGGRSVEPPLTDLARLGFDPNNFYGPLCHLSTEDEYDGGCKMNPWYFPGRNPAPKVSEFQCARRKSERHKLRLSEWRPADGAPTSAPAQQQQTPAADVQLLSPARQLARRSADFGGAMQGKYGTRRRSDRVQVVGRGDGVAEEAAKERRAVARRRSGGGGGLGGDEEEDNNNSKKKKSSDWKSVATTTASPSPPTATQQQQQQQSVAEKEQKISEEALREKVLLNWKRHTSWMFDKWYDWNAKCVPPDDFAPPTPMPSTTTRKPTTVKTVATKHRDDDDDVEKSQTTSKPRPRPPPPPKPPSQYVPKPEFGANNGEIRGGHGREHLYVLENFCLKPMGRLAGHWPRTRAKPHVTEYQGTHEAGKVNGVMTSHTGDAGPREWLADNNIEIIREKPKCFYDNKIVILPITVHSGNVGHLWHRNGGLLRYIETAFGEKARDQLEDVLVIYVVTNRGYGFTSTPDANANLNVQKYFYDIMGTAWASTFVESIPAIRNAWKDDLLRADPDDETIMKMMMEQQQNATQHNSKNKNRRIIFPMSNAALNQHICFRQGFVWHNAFHGAAKKTGFAAANAPGHRFTFHLFGYRSRRDVDTLNMLIGRMDQCPAPPLAPRRKEANRVNPHVIFIVRSASRRFALQPHIINVMADYVQKELNGTFEVLEHIGLDFDEVIDRFSKCDILIGMLGAGLLWLELLPPGGVVIEFNAVGYRCAVVAGINNNPLCDFGGSAAGAQLYHVAIANNFDALNRFPPNYGTIQGNDVMQRHGGGHQDNAAGGLLVRWALGRAKCLFEHAVFNNTHVVQIVPPQCQFADGVLTAVVQQDVRDVKGNNLAAFVQMHLPPMSGGGGGNSSSSEHHHHHHHHKNKNDGGAGGGGDDHHHHHNNNNNDHDHAVDHVNYDNDPSVVRMKMMMKHRAPLSRHLGPYRGIGATRNEIIRIHILVPCAANTTSVVAEAEAWRGIIRDLYRVVVAEYADGVDNCPPAPTEPEELPASATTKSWLGIHVCRFPCPATQPYHIVVRTVKQSRRGEKDPAAIRRAILELYVINTHGTLITFNPAAGNVTVAAITNNNEDGVKGGSGRKEILWKDL